VHARKNTPCVWRAAVSGGNSPVPAATQYQCALIHCAGMYLDPALDLKIASDQPGLHADAAQRRGMAGRGYAMFLFCKIPLCIAMVSPAAQNTPAVSHRVCTRGKRERNRKHAKIRQLAK
jgi:hypothetical protein